MPTPKKWRRRPLLMVFDLHYRAGHDQTKRPLRERRARLEGLVTGADRIFPVRRLTSNGLIAWAEVLEKGFEGYVAKDEASPYVGGVTRAWLKVKVPGWTDPEDRWKRVPGSNGEQMAARLKALRERRGLTQEQRAEMSGVSRTYLARLETGPPGPNAEHAGEAGQGARREGGKTAGMSPEPLRRLPLSRLIVEARPTFTAVIHPPTEKTRQAVQGASRRDALYGIGVTLRADVAGGIFTHR